MFFYFYNQKFGANLPGISCEPEVRTLYLIFISSLILGHICHRNTPILINKFLHHLLDG